MLQSVSARSRGEDNLALFRADKRWVDDFVGGSFLEDAVLVDAAAVGVGVGSDDGLVALDDHSGVSRDHAGDRQELCGVDAGFEAEVVLANKEAHDDLFQSCVAGSLTDAIDGDFNLPCSTQNACERIGGSHAEVVVAVAAEDGLVAVRNVFDDALDEGSVFLWIGEAGGVGHVDRGRACIDHGFDDSVNIFSIGSTGVLHEVLDIVCELAGDLDRVDAGFERLIRAHSKLVDKVVFADAKAGVDSL